MKRVILPLVTLSLLLAHCSSNKQYPHMAIPLDMQGQWTAMNVKVTVRTNPSFMNFEFFPDTVDILLHFKDTSVNGSIGQAQFTNAPLRINGGNPERTGIEYIVECGYIGRGVTNWHAFAEEIFRLANMPFDLTTISGSDLSF